MEYGLILAILALGVIGVMHVFRRAVGDMTNRTAVIISKQSATGYASGSSLGGGGSGAGSPVSPEPPVPPPDSLSAGGEPPCAGGSATCTLAGYKTAH